MKKINLLLFIGIILISSCSSLHKAQRKAKKVNKLLTEIKVLAPEILDSVLITKVDTMYLIKDSLVFKTKIKQDTSKIDSLLNLYASLKNSLSLSEATQHTITTIRDKIIYEAIPDTLITKKDSLTVVIQGKEQKIIFNTSVLFEKGVLIIKTVPISNLTFISTETKVNIEATKKGKWWSGFKWGMFSLIIILIALWVFRGVIQTTIKSIMP